MLELMGGGHCQVEVEGGRWEDGGSGRWEDSGNVS